ncbi:alpha/beta hydrolase [Roseibium sp. LAB1]
MIDKQASPERSGSLDPARPFFFEGLAGYFHPAGGSTAILLLSPWGYEELCSRKSYRMLGEKLAAAGYPCLRFDYPGTGNSAGRSDAVDDSSAWRTAVKTALTELQRHTGARRLLVIGQGVGASLAGVVAQEASLAGLVLLAPVLPGRAYLRELAAWTAMTQPTFLVNSSDGPEGGLMAGGFVLSRSTAEELKTLNLLKVKLPAELPTLLMERPDHPGDQKLADQLLEDGVSLERLPFDGYADYVSDPTLSVVPEATLDRIVSWVRDRLPEDCANKKTASADQVAPDNRWSADGLNEELVRFGKGNMFFGALTLPADKSVDTAVVILNSGYDHSIGWARMAVDFSRALAESGVAVLRVDLAGIGESRYWPDQQPQVLYSDRQVADVTAAVNWLSERLQVKRIILAGRCSGAYLTLLAAAQEPSVSAAFLINPRRLVWDPDEDVDQAIREPIETLGTYSQKLFENETVRRVLSGDINLLSAGKKVARALSTKADKALAPVIRSLSKHHRLSSVLFNRLDSLQNRNVPVCLVYSEGDRGLGELALWFGADTSGLKAYPNVTVASIANADHNLTPLKARQEVETLLVDFASGVGRLD